ncbi:MAG: hypothetical protein U5L45_01410 [Saprospiraceae bacterium]|nr:hypothetical protein [Saprospiraceae bacterium]
MGLRPNFQQKKRLAPLEFLGGEVRFSAKPKNEPHSPPPRERSEREMQKTLLGYAHPSMYNYRKTKKLS